LHVHHSFPSQLQMQLEITPDGLKLRRPPKFTLKFYWCVLYVGSYPNCENEMQIFKSEPKFKPPYMVSECLVSCIIYILLVGSRYDY
jgi:hypothetical protein